MKKIAKPDFLLHACRLYTSEIDKNLEKRGGQAVLSSIEEQGEEFVTLWQPFEHWPKDEICEAIEDASTLLEQMWDVGFRAGQLSPKPVKKRMTYNKGEQFYARHKNKGGNND